MSVIVFLFEIDDPQQQQPVFLGHLALFAVHVDGSLDGLQGLVVAGQLKQRLSFEHHHVSAGLRNNGHQFTDGYQGTFIVFLGELELSLGLQRTLQQGFRQVWLRHHLVVCPDGLGIIFLQIVGISGDVPDLGQFVRSQAFLAPEFVDQALGRGIVLGLDQFLDFSQVFVNRLAHGHGFLGLLFPFLGAVFSGKDAAGCTQQQGGRDDCNDQF